MDSHFVLGHVWVLRVKPYLLRKLHTHPATQLWWPQRWAFFCLGCNIWLFWQARKFAHPGTLPLNPYTRVYPLTSPKTSLFSAHMYTHVDIISCAQLRLQACLVLTALWWPREEGLILAPSPSLGPMPWLQELGGRCHAGAQCVMFLWPKPIAFNA